MTEVDAQGAHLCAGRPQSVLQGESSGARGRRAIAALALILSLAAVLDTIVVFRMSITADERLHPLYGRRILNSSPDRLPRYDSHMPVSALNALPNAIASRLAAHRALPGVSAALGAFRANRFPTVVAALALNLLIFLWASELYGAVAGLAACLLSALSPSLIAHGSLATNDMYHAVAVVGSLYSVRRYLLRPTPKRALLAALFLALAQLTKVFAIAVYAVAGIAVGLAWFRGGYRERFRGRHAVMFAAAAVSLFLLVLNAAYSFDRTFTRLSLYEFQSRAFTRLQQWPLVGQAPVPVPYPFLQGLDMMKHNEETGESFGNVYVLGKLGQSRDPSFQGFKWYYAAAIFFKEPIALQLLFLSGLIWIWRNRKAGEFLAGEGLLLGAAGILVLWLSLFSRAQIGIRHILPALAIEVIVAGAAFAHFTAAPRRRKAVLGLAVAWVALSAASYFPHMIPYMNEWSYDRRLAYRILADSNLDWRQDAAVVEEFLRKNPDVVLDPAGPVAGRVLAGANVLTGVDRWRPSLAWLGTRYRPVAHVGYAHFLFVLPPQPEDRATR